MSVLQQHVLALNVSAFQEYVLPPDMSVQQQHMLALDVSVIQQYGIPREMPVLQQHVLALNVSVMQLSVLPLDVSVLQQPVCGSRSVHYIANYCVPLQAVLPQDMSVLYWSWTCLLYSNRRCPWTCPLDSSLHLHPRRCLAYSSLCCSRTSLQEDVLHLFVLFCADPRGCLSTGAYTLKKNFSIFPSPAGISLTKLSLGGNNDVIFKLFPPRESLVSDIPAGDGNIEKLFLQCMLHLSMCFCADPGGLLSSRVYAAPVLLCCSWICMSSIALVAHLDVPIICGLFVESMFSMR
jgi:hypothetical protein